METQKDSGKKDGKGIRIQASVFWLLSATAILFIVNLVVSMRVSKKIESLLRLRTLSDRVRDQIVELQTLVAHQRFYTFLIVLLTVIIFVLIGVLVLKPISEYMACMEKTENLPVIGSQEMRILAKGYNEALRDNAADNLILQHEAEHDALTGLFNRGAFEKMKVYLSDSLEPIALLLIDVDLFKHVNDNYGHEIGDAALKKVANLLKEKFRASDMAFRVGGDEFCIIMTKVTPNEKNVIKDKITSVNEALAKPDEAVPLKLSLSVGIAFEQLGFNEELYSKADKALYYTKEHGRCGFTFYSSHAEM